jgi:hypothetical protein
VKEYRELTCKGCHRTAEVPIPQAGHPYGWYSLSVNLPEGLNNDGKAYRWIGTFCSVGCLVSYEDQLIAWQERLEGLYERE